ncbi:unnamed protein product [[Candida] boidinii]|uniref:Unnamed protein product n=1 Tax=Candida boidinii TaxID=5477 RepID=A0A9W6T802_CANBO|nr:hypothetical protein B5S30_g960 [[Candida] boidinii]OWB81631.1 hypothetical protein B5S33_g250 [[Candida] boidinii]GME81133.1 unnamed protein product [[Candida] boidinii]GMG13742.1 unnamed protein product [[Candida] boidinii]
MSEKAPNTTPSVPPFPNVYKGRTVSESDAKSCSICYKPTTKCLVSCKYLNENAGKNIIDFFYICEIHLKDRKFCSIIYIDENDSSSSSNSLTTTGVSKEKNIKKLEIDEAEIMNKIKHLENILNYKENNQFNKIKNYLWKSSNSDKKDKNSDDDKDKDKKSEPEVERNDTDLSIEELKANIKNLNLEFTSKQKLLNEFKTKYGKYKLDSLIYRNRLNTYFKKLIEIENYKKLQDPSFFPSVSHLTKPN